MTRSLERPTEPNHRTEDTRTLLVDTGPDGLRVVRRRRRDELRARLRGAALDRRLAAGEAPERDRLLATRAALLVRPRFRDTVARRWEGLAVRARRRDTGQVPIARERVHAAAAEIDLLVSTLRSGRPVAAGGVAAAWLLLTYADSPVYALRSTGDVAGALTRALATM